MSSSVLFAERTRTSLPWGASKNELLDYVHLLREKLEEEVEELIDSLADEDTVALLDAHNDIMVYMKQFKNALVKAGVSVSASQNAVDSNNELKYTSSKELAEKWQNEWDTQGQEYELCETEYEGDIYYCLKDENGKVRKPVGHPKVDLLPFIPEELL